jgi:hypothetical protein
MLHQLLYARAPVTVISAFMKAQVPKLGTSNPKDFDHCWYILMKPAYFKHEGLHVAGREGLPDALSLAVQQGRQEVVELVSEDLQLTWLNIRLQTPSIKTPSSKLI